MKLLILSFLIVLGFQSFGQEKFEREHKISIEEVPQQALKFINSPKLTNKIKWYREINSEYSTIEAKTEVNGIKYSIEFTLDGLIEDIEVEIKFNKLSEKTRQNIREVLDSTFIKHKIRKTQIQYVGEPKELKHFLEGTISADNLSVNYEVVLKAKDLVRWSLYEFLFSEEGSLLDKNRIVFRNTDNLKY